MIRRINKADLQRLLAVKDETLLTIYAPLQAGVQGHKFNRSQLHNVKSELKSNLSDKQHDQISNEIEALLDAIDHASDSLGVAIFYNGTKAEVFTLPFTPEKLTQIDSVYILTQIQGYFDQDTSYYVLALSKKGSNLYKGDMNNLKLVPLAKLGKDIKTTLHIDELGSSGLQSHPSGPAGNRKSGYHGQGGYKDIKKALLADYLRSIDKIILEDIQDKDTPLILASVDYEQSAYKKVSHYPNIHPVGISNNPDHMTIKQMHDKAFAIVGPKPEAQT